MKIIKTTSGHNKIRISYQEWQKIGQQLGTIKTAGLPVVQFKKFYKWLKEKNYQLVSTRGSHQKWCNSQTKECVVVSNHGRDKNIHPLVLKQVLRDMNIPLSQFRSETGI